MTIEVERAHLVVHLLQRSTLHGVNLRKKLWKCSQRSLKEDNPVKDVLFLQIQSLDILYPNVPWSCRPYWYSNVITCTDSTVEHTEDEGLGANILVLRCVRWQKLELSCRTSIREKFSQVNHSALVDIVIRFHDTDLSLLICLSVIEVKTEGNRHLD